MSSKEPLTKRFSEPKHQPESPFLDEAIFADKDAQSTEEWRSRTNGYMLKSHFQHAFELEREEMIEQEIEESAEFDEELYDGEEKFDEYDKVFYEGELEELDEEREFNEYKVDNELNDQELDEEFETEVNKKKHARPDLGVSARQVTAYDWAFRKKKGKKFKELVEWAADEVDINPGLLAVNLIAETRMRDYFAKSKVSSFLVGTDDFYDKRHDISRKVPAYSKIGWNKNQKPVGDLNETDRIVRTIHFDSGRDALLASAVYLKHGEVVLRQEAQKVGKDFDTLPVETRFALTRLAFHAGHGRAKKNLRQVLEGKEILIRKRKARAGPQRKATIHTARAMHLSELIFGISTKVMVQPEVRTFEEIDEEEGIDEYEFEQVGVEGETPLGEGFNVPQDVAQGRVELFEEPYAEGEEFLAVEGTVEEVAEFPEAEAPFDEEEALASEETELTFRPEYEIESEVYLDEEVPAYPFDELTRQEGETLVQGELNAAGVNRAIRLNPQYAKKLKWGIHRDQIKHYLYSSKSWINSPWPEGDFSRAVARWQKKHDLKPDGIIGPKSWNRMKVLMCLGYQSGEVTKSHTQSGHLKQDVFMTKRGWLVIADFGVGRSEIKTSTRREELLREWLEKFEGDPPDEILIIGFSDCVGEENNNEAMRRSRALEVSKLFGPKARAKARVFSGKMGKYVADSNLTSKSRAMNRSVLIQWKRDIGFGTEDVRGKVISLKEMVDECLRAIDRQKELGFNLSGDKIKQIRCALNKIVDPRVDDLYISRAKWDNHWNYLWQRNSPENLESDFMSRFRECVRRTYNRHSDKPRDEFHRRIIRDLKNSDDDLVKAINHAHYLRENKDETMVPGDRQILDWIASKWKRSGDNIYKKCHV